MTLVSAPVDHFDATLIKHASQDWQVAARIVGATLVDEAIQPGTAEIGDFFISKALASG